MITVTHIKIAAIAVNVVYVFARTYVDYGRLSGSVPHLTIIGTAALAAPYALAIATILIALNPSSNFLRVSGLTVASLMLIGIIALNALALGFRYPEPARIFVERLVEYPIYLFDLLLILNFKYLIDEIGT
jgi:hypothetical protein